VGKYVQGKSRKTLRGGKKGLNKAREGNILKENDEETRV